MRFLKRPSMNAKAAAKSPPNPAQLERPRSLREQIHERLRQAILSGELAPGAPVIEADLAARLGASRTPVREALRRLESEGLVEPRGLRGSVVRAVSADEIICIYEIRERLEGLAAQRASRTMGDDDYRALTELVRRMQASLADPIAFEQADSAFHDYVIEHADGPRLRRMLTDLREEITTWRFLSLSNLERRKITIKEHRAIVAAMRAHDEDAVAAAMSLHIAHARDSVLARRAEQDARNRTA